jgi:hypothetical protein
MAWDFISGHPEAELPCVAFADSQEILVKMRRGALRFP